MNYNTSRLLILSKIHDLQKQYLHDLQLENNYKICVVCKQRLNSYDIYRAKIESGEEAP